jgi:hypothetical protein
LSVGTPLIAGRAANNTVSNTLSQTPLITHFLQFSGTDITMVHSESQVMARIDAYRME